MRVQQKQGRPIKTHLEQDVNLKIVLIYLPYIYLIFKNIQGVQRLALPPPMGHALLSKMIENIF